MAIPKQATRKPADTGALQDAIAEYGAEALTNGEITIEEAQDILDKQQSVPEMPNPAQGKWSTPWDIRQNTAPGRSQQEAFSGLPQGPVAPPIKRLSELMKRGEPRLNAPTVPHKQIPQVVPGLDQTPAVTPPGPLATSPAMAQAEETVANTPPLPVGEFNIEARLKAFEGDKNVNKAAELKSIREEANKRIMSLPYPEEDISNMYNLIANRPEMRDQLAGIDEQEKAIKQLENAQEAPQSSWLKPLMALVDSETGSRLLSGYEPGPGRKDRLALLEHKNKLQQRRGDVAKEIMGTSEKLLKGGSQTDSDLSRLSEMLGGKSGAGSFDRQDMLERRQAGQAHLYVMRQLDTNKQLADDLKVMKGLDMTLTTLGKVSKITPAQLIEAQRAIMNAMSIGRGGTTGVDERSQMYLKTLPIDVANRVVQWVTGKPSDISPNDPIVEHIKNLAQVEGESMKEYYGRGLSAVSGGFDWMYDGSDPRFDKYATALESKLGLKKRQSAPLPGSPPKVEDRAMRTKREKAAKSSASETVRVIDVATGKAGKMPRSRIREAVASGRFKLGE